MDVLKVGDIVARKSYDADIIFKIVAIGKDSVLLRGVQCRVMADAPLDDLVKVSNEPSQALQHHHSSLRQVHPGRMEYRSSGTAGL
ncbi:MAG: hypothetical protein HPY71_04715 [Firmicutes bacterium]|nr:hypothetical protein [Bacillota bacterium]